MIGSQLINRYEIVAELGKGGMGVVYLAKDPILDRRVAVKMLPAGYMSKETEDRLRREARLVARMDHQAITPVFDLGTHEGSLFVVMPVLRGETIRHLIDVGRLSLGDVLTIATQVADALDYSHAKGVIHRDIKPENVMVGRERGHLRARVMDFGLARDPLAHRSITQSGGIIGTLTYMSPEQVQAKPVDHRSDLYSFGAVLYECLSGHAPFTGPVHQLIVDIARDTPVPLGDSHRHRPRSSSPCGPLSEQRSCSTSAHRTRDRPCPRRMHSSSGRKPAHPFGGRTQSPHGSSIHYLDASRGSADRAQTA